MRDVMKHLGSIHDGDSLVWLDNRDVAGAWIVFVEGEHDFRNPDKHRMTERQAEELVWKVHNN